MSSYPSAPPPAWTPSQYRGDPTAVMGRRIGAYFLDGLIGLIIVGGITVGILAATTPWKHYTNVSDASHQCSVYNDQDHGDKVCVDVNDSEVYLVHVWPVIGTFLGVSAGWWLINAVLIEGLAGGRIGKLIVGLRVVRPNGQLAGPGWALLRNLLLIIPDQIFAGLVGLITSLASEGHRRVGDMVADTYVVDRQAVGQPVLVGSMAWVEYGAPGQPGQPAQPWGQQWGQPGQAGQWGQPGRPGQPGQPGQPAQHEPQWDSARNTYIWWDDERHEWLEHDQESGQWRPLSR